MLRHRANRERGGIEANLTSLIDVTFLLIVFFVLVSRLNEIELVDLDLPSPAHAASEAIESERQVVISLLPGEGGTITAYRVGVSDYPPGKAGCNAITAHLADLYRMNPKLDVNVRADRSTHYEHVEPVIEAVSAAARTVADAHPDVECNAAGGNLMVTRGTDE